MLKKIILIENDNTIQCDTLEEVVKTLIDENFYHMTPSQRIEKMRIKALANCINNKKKVVQGASINGEESIEDKFIVQDEITYILSLLTTNNILLLERKDSDIFTKDLNKENLKDNYIIVNKFANDLLKKYIMKDKKKSEIKNILFSMRTAENEEIINNLLGRIDSLSEEKINDILGQVGVDEKSIRKYLQEKINSFQEQHEAHTKINKMFSYGISGNSIHLHMPVDLHEMFSKMGILKTINTVNLYLLDAIDRIRVMRAEGYNKFLDKDNIYMISPILLRKELAFLSNLDFTTHIYKKKELQDEQFVAEHPKSQLAIRIFGNSKDVGTAIIGFDTINSKEWQDKKSKQVQILNEKGIKLEDEDKSRE